MRFDKRKLRREIEAARREAVKAKLRELKDKIKEARIARREDVRAVQLDCRLKREELRQSCGLRKARAKESGAAEVLRRADALESERRFERQMRAADRPRKLRSTARERRAESDDEVRGNISPDLVPIFNAIARHIKPGARRSRTEAFLEWVEENPGEVYDLMQRDADRYLQQLLAEQAQAEEELRPRRRRASGAVPF
jgi:hypothetical protein